MSVRAAQIFDVFGAYNPLKTSLFLKRTGVNSNNCFVLDSSFSIDASNFYQISQGSNKAIFDDSHSGFTDNGYVINRVHNGLIWPSIEYPIKTSVPGKFNVHLRMQSPSGNIKASILIDGNRVSGIDDSTSADTWGWFRTDFGIPDNEKHILGIRLEEDALALDKVYLDSGFTSVSGSGPDSDESPYVTIHLQLYEADGQYPLTALDVYDFKTTIDKVTTDDWYNFSLQPIDSSIDIDFEGSYALVLSSSGSSDDNFVVWEFVDNDEYLILPSAFMVKND